MPKSPKFSAAAAAPVATAGPTGPDLNPMGAAPDEIAKNRHFDALYGAWLMARAKMQPPNFQGDDDAMDRMLAEETAALRELVTTPAPTEARVWSKIEALDVELDGEALHGERPAIRTTLILAAIKADLLNFSFGG